MSDIEEIVHELEARFDDVALRYVRAWKDAAPGRLAVGCMPVFAPREVMWAAGALPVFVRGGGDRVETVRGDAYYQSYICHIPRSTLELGLAGHLDVLDGMVFPNTCDVIRNLSGVWQGTFPQHLVRFLDPPQSADAASAVPYLRAELRAFWRELSQRSGRAMSDEALTAAVDEYRAAGEAMERLAAARVAEPWKLPFDEVYLLRRAGDAMPPMDFVALVDRYLAAARARGRRPEDRIRVLLVGAFCEQPPLALLRAIERAGCYVVDDDLTLGLEGAPDTAGDDPLDRVARAWLASARPSAVRFDAQGTAGTELAARARGARADGVIFAAPSFCDPALLDQPRLTRVLEAEGIPYTAFKYAENTGQFQSIREQSGTFADSVKLWGHA